MLNYNSVQSKHTLRKCSALKRSMRSDFLSDEVLLQDASSIM